MIFAIALDNDSFDHLLESDVLPIVVEHSRMIVDTASRISEHHALIATMIVAIMIGMQEDSPHLAYDSKVFAKVSSIDHFLNF